MKSNEKWRRTTKENIDMILSGYKIVLQVYRRYVIWNITNCILRSIVPYFSLYMTSLIINELTCSRDSERLLGLAAVTVCGLFLANMICRWIEGYANVYGSDTWRLDLLYYLKKQNRMQYRYLEDADISLLREKIYSAKTSTGGGIQIMLWNIETLVKAILNIVCSVVLTISLFSYVSEHEYTGFLGLINSPIAMLVLVMLIVVNATISIVTTNKETQQVEKEWQELANMNRKYRALNLWGHDTFIFNMHRIILRELEKFNHPQYIIRAQRHKMKYGMFRILWNYIMTMALFVFIAAKVYIGILGIGNFILYQGTVTKFMEGVSDVANVIGRLIQNNVPLANLLSFMNIPEETERGTLSVEKNVSSEYEIEFRNVSFKYPNSDSWALRNVSVKFKSGTRLAIVGMNGSGKTTFVKLLCRLYEPTEGQILLNGIDISQYRYNEYLEIFSVVFQDYKLFSFSIAENIAATKEYDKEKVLSCIKLSGLGKKVQELTDGVATCLHQDFEDDGISISGGEAQKLAIARALYKDSPFLVLDEPTAALDPMAEAEIYSQFNKAIVGPTVIFISHRLSSCRFCENVLVFDRAELVQQGSHEKLVSDTEGKYYELWNTQAQYYVE